MADRHENSVASRDSSLVITDKARIVGVDGKSYITTLSVLAKLIVESYAGTTLAGAARSVQAAVNALNAAITAEVTNRNTAIASAISAEVSNRNVAISSAIASEASNRNTAIATAVAAEAKSRDEAIAAKTGDLSGLSTDAKSNLVSAVNEVDASAGAANATANAAKEGVDNLRSSTIFAKSDGKFYVRVEEDS